MVFLKIEYIRRDLPLLCIFYSQSTLGVGFVRPNGFSAGVFSQRGFGIFFYATEGMNNVPVTIELQVNWNDNSGGEIEAS